MKSMPAPYKLGSIKILRYKYRNNAIELNNKKRELRVLQDKYNKKPKIRNPTWLIRHTEISVTPSLKR